MVGVTDGGESARGGGGSEDGKVVAGAREVWKKINWGKVERLFKGEEGGVGGQARVVGGGYSLVEGVSSLEIGEGEGVGVGVGAGEDVKDLVRGVENL